MKPTEQLMKPDFDVAGAAWTIADESEHCSDETDYDAFHETNETADDTTHR